VLPSTAAGVALLAARAGSSSCLGLDAVLIVLGLAVVVGCPCALAALWVLCTVNDGGSGRGVWECRARPGAPSHARVRWLPWCLAPVAATLHRAWKWHAVGDGSAPLLQAAWVVLLEYRMLWFAALDSGAIVVVAVLAVAGGLDTANDALCQAAVAVVLVLMSCQLLLVLRLRPYTTLFAVVNGTVTLVLTCLSIGAQLAFVVSSTPQSPKLWLVDASAGCDFAVVGVTAVKMLLDAKDTVDAVVRRLLMSAAPCDSADDSWPTVKINSEVDDDVVGSSAGGFMKTSSFALRAPVAMDGMLSHLSNDSIITRQSHEGAVRSPGVRSAQVDALECSSSFDLERANAYYWDAAGSARLLATRAGANNSVNDDSSGEDVGTLFDKHRVA
jgi:hypothetical protein